MYNGSIMLKTNPQDFSAYINGKIEESKKLNRINNSYNLAGLMPGSYELSINADQFQTWTKKIEVHSGIASEFWNVLLVRNDYERTSYSAQGLDKFFISPKDDRIVIVQNSDAGASVKILNIQNKAMENSFFFASTTFDNIEKKENIEWSPDGDRLSIPLKMSASIKDKKNLPAQKKTAQPAENSQEMQKYSYFITDLVNDDQINLNLFVNKIDIRNVRWDPKDRDYIFFLSENSLYRANITDANNITLIADNVSAFDLSKTSVYYAQSPNKLIYKIALDGIGNRDQITNDFPDSTINLITRLIAYDDDRMSFLSNDNKLFIYNKGEREIYFKKLGDDVQGTQFSNDGKKMLYWTNNEFHVYFLRDWTVQPNRSENDIQTITRYSEDIKNVQWFKDYEHVIFSAGSYVKIIELDARDHRNCMDILNIQTDTPFLTYNNALERLFFVDKNDDSSDLYSIVFPEPGGLLGIFPPAQQ